MLVLSDGTGDTGEKMVRAALQQFKGHLVHVRTYAHITRPEQLRSWFRVAARQGACVITTLVARSTVSTAPTNPSGETTGSNGRTPRRDPAFTTRVRPSVIWVCRITSAGRYGTVILEVIPSSDRSRSFSARTESGSASATARRR